MNREPESSLTLRDDRIIETVDALQHRIRDRFPGSGLQRLCEQLHEVAKKAAERSAWIANPIRWIRLVSLILTLLLIAFLVGSVFYALQTLEDEQISFIDFVQAIESGLNDIIFFAIAIFFLFSLETRIKRRRALAAVHELRSIAHVIDMHQLTKDPERIVRGYSGAEHSPKETMAPSQLNRYLDYCSEMLSLTGKIAALYVQRFDDANAVAAVSEVEQLSTGLSRKIWQKIMLLHEIREQQDLEAARAPLPSASGNAPSFNDPTDEQSGNAQETDGDDHNP